MPKTPKFPQWRPDKVCMPILSEEELEEVPFYIKAMDAQKIGAFCTTPYKKDKMEDIKDDGVVRTPSDHMGIIIDIGNRKN